MKLVLVIPSLGGGGAQRVMVTLANAWAAEKDDVTLITLAGRGRDKFSLDAAVERIDLQAAQSSPNLLAALANNLGRVSALRRAIKRCHPDAVISFTTTANLLSVLAAAGLKIPVIVSERIFVEAYPPRGAWRTMYRTVYRRAAAVVAQTRRGAADIEGKVDRDVHVIPNPLRADAGVGDSTEHSPGAMRDERDVGRTLVAMGRLSPQKGFDLLVEAFARIAPRHSAWRMVILGEGVLRKDLTGLIAARGLRDRISLPGFCDAPQRELQRADLFAMSSHFEGFPMALLEAMSEGVACVSFDCPTGPRELIEHGVNGWLVAPGSISALAAALDALMADAPLRKRLGARACEVRNTYSLPAVIAKWNALLDSVRQPSRSAVGAMPRRMEEKV